MKSLEQREQNLFNATETMAQFYDEIESFLSILYSSMERKGFAVKTERLRSGTIAVKNLTRRLLATVSVMYIKDSAKPADTDEEEEDEGIEIVEKDAKDTDVTVTKNTKMPLLTIHMFNPRVIPTAHTLSSPLLLIGAIGDLQFANRKTGEFSTEDSHTIGLSNLGQILLKPGNQVGSIVGTRCWKPKSIRNLKIVGKLIGFESIRLFEMD
ncbi:hypothetical protein ACFL5Z_08470, partial [Planctomycetota bacterium]